MARAPGVPSINVDSPLLAKGLGRGMAREGNNDGDDNSAEKTVKAPHEISFLR